MNNKPKPKGKNNKSGIATDNHPKHFEVLERGLVKLGSKELNAVELIHNRANKMSLKEIGELYNLSDSNCKTALQKLLHEFPANYVNEYRYLQTQELNILKSYLLKDLEKDNITVKDRQLIIASYLRIHERMAKLHGLDVVPTVNTVSFQFDNVTLTEKSGTPLTKLNKPVDVVVNDISKEIINESIDNGVSTGVDNIFDNKDNELNNSLDISSLTKDNKFDTEIEDTAIDIELDK
jgi:hypothetical protein